MSVDRCRERGFHQFVMGMPGCIVCDEPAPDLGPIVMYDGTTKVYLVFEDVVHEGSWRSWLVSAWSTLEAAEREAARLAAADRLYRVHEVEKRA